MNARSFLRGMAVLAAMGWITEESAAEVHWRSGAATAAPQTATEVRASIATLASDLTQRHVVVHFAREVTPGDRAALQAAGVTLQAYLGNNAFFAVFSRPDVDADRVSRAAPLAAVERVQRPWKLAPFLAAGNVPSWAVVSSEQTPAGRVDTVRAHVLFHRDVALDPDALGIVRKHGAVVRDELETINGLVIELPFPEVASLADEDAVQWVEPPLPRLGENNNSNRQITGADVVQTPPYELDGAGVNVLVYDAGRAQSAHVDFGGRLVTRDNSSVIGHATHVAGTIGGSGLASSGLYRGMAPGVTMQSYGFQWDGSFDFLYDDPGDLEHDYDEAINLYGVDISNNSIGSNICANLISPIEVTGDYSITDVLIDGIVSGSMGSPFRVVWSNGNERVNTSFCQGPGGHTPDGYHSTSPPACAKNHLTVGALNSNDDSMTYFSSWGPCDDGRLKPDVTGPGCQVGGDNGVTSCAGTSSYSVSCGTSMSGPTVTGLGALLLQDFREQFPGQPDFRNSTLRILFAHTAVDRGNTGPDYQFGYGSVRIQPAIDFMRTGSFLEAQVGQGGTHTVYVTVAPTDTVLKVTLAWDDPPGTPNVVPSLINDLDLVVLDPSLGQHFPWTLNPSVPSAPAVRTQADHINNIEQVLVNAPAPGVWRVEVRGLNVPQGPQSFSLCSSPTLSQCIAGGGDCNGNGVPDGCETVVYVDVDAPGANDGSSWADAFTDLQDALDFALCSGFPVEIRVAQGTYRPDRGTLDRGAHFSLLDGATLLGGYAGYGTPNPDDRSPAAYVTSLNGDLLGNDGPDFANRGDNSYSVVSKAGTTSAAVLDGFTIRGGNAETGGGGGLSGDGSPLVRDCTFTDNFAVGGGAVHNGDSSSSPTFEDCRFMANRAWAGGAIYNIGAASPTITGCEFSDNSAVAFGAWGGAMYNALGSNPVMDSCSFTGNSAESDGGAVFNVADSHPAFSYCTFSDNNAGAGGAVCSYDGSNPQWADCSFTGNSATYGGALYNADNAAQITNCTFSGNSATRGGGVYYTSAAAGTLTDGLFSGNLASDLGGAVYLNACSPTITGVVFDGNVGGPDGGAIYNNGGNPALTLCWFESNLAVGRGGAVHNVGGANPTFAGCAFVTNSATMGGALGSENSTPTVTNCTFDSNAANEGGALYHYKWPSITGNPRFIDCTFALNTAVQFGGAVFNDDNVRAEFDDCLFEQNVAGLRGGAMWTWLAGAPAIRDCRFAGNHSDADGGALYYSGGTVDITDSTFYVNYALKPDGSGSRGGAIYNTGASGCMTNCKLIHNVAFGLVGHGGGIYNYSTASGGSAIDLTNCLFDGNATYTGISSGGGIYNEGGTVRVRNCTLGSNWAMQQGGAIHTRGATGSLLVTNSVLWSNVHNGGVMDATAQIYVAGGTATVNESDIQGCWTGAGSNNICLDPLYRDLYGPDGSYGTEDDDLRVDCADSPVVNNGSNALVPPDACDVDDDGNTTETVPIDLDTLPRIRSITVDMGAYECPLAGGGIKPKTGTQPQQ